MIRTKVVQQSAQPMGWLERIYLPELVKGIAITVKHFAVNLFTEKDPSPEVLERQGPNLVSTINYPEEPSPYPPGYRGLHRLVPRPDGKPRCVACYMCAQACPAKCIYIEAGEYPDEGIEKFPVRFEIDELRCVVCGLCVEACPEDAIRMDTGTHTPPGYTREQTVWTKEHLLRGLPVWHTQDRFVPPPAPGQPCEVLEGGPPEYPGLVEPETKPPPRLLPYRGGGEGPPH